MNKTVNQKAWFLVLPVLILVAFSAVIPLMTVVNYSVQDTFGRNEFFWAGLEWFSDMLDSDRMWDALGRQLIFSGVILAIEIPLGIFVALNMPKNGFCLTQKSSCSTLLSTSRNIRNSCPGALVAASANGRNISSSPT